MSKITANDTHRHDDIADNLYDAIKIALIDKSLILNTKQSGQTAAIIGTKQKLMNQSRNTFYHGGNQ